MYYNFELHSEKTYLVTYAQQGFKSDCASVHLGSLSSDFIVRRRNFATLAFQNAPGEDNDQGPVVQSVVSLTSSLRVISLTVLADSIHNILIFFAEKM